jgi:ribosome recycling factor
LLVHPYDKGALGNIEKAIRSSDLGFNPTNDGTQIRIVIPQLTEERRRDLVKLVHKRVEEARIAIRNVRRDTNDHVRKLKKDKDISEDEERRAEEQLQKLTDRTIRDAESIGQNKEAEMLEL